MKIGYARISTPDQKIELQEDALKEEGCRLIYKDVSKGSKTERPGLTEAFTQLRDGDTLVVWRLDRLGRTLMHLIKTVKELKDKNIGFKSITESIDTTSISGQLIFHIFGALAEFERAIILERTMAGLKAARARGRLGGRPVKLSKCKARRMIELYDEKKVTVSEICKIYSLSHTGFYLYLSKRGQYV